MRIYIMFLFTWQSLFRVSDAGMGVLFMFFATFLGLLASGLHINALNELIALLPQMFFPLGDLLGTNQIHLVNMQAVENAILYIQSIHARLHNQTSQCAHEGVHMFNLQTTPILLQCSANENS